MFKIDLNSILALAISWCGSRIEPIRSKTPSGCAICYVIVASSQRVQLRRHLKNQPKSFITLYISNKI